MDKTQKQTKSSALTTLPNDNNTKPDPRRISSSPSPRKRKPQRKRKPVKYNDDDDYNDIDEEHVVKSDSEDEFEAEQKKKKQKKSQRKQVASTSTTALVAPTTKPKNKHQAKTKAATQKKKDIAKAYNKKLNEFHDKLKKDNKASGVQVNNSTIKKGSVKIQLSNKPIRQKNLSFNEQDTFLLSEGAWTQDRFKAIICQFNNLSEAEKRPFLERILQDPSSWDDYSSITSATRKLFSVRRQGQNPVQLNFSNEKEFHSMRQKEITSRGLVDQPEFNTARKNSFIRQITRTIIGEIEKSSKPKDKKPKATIKLQSTKDRASAALARGRPQDVIMESNHWKESASFLYMS